MSKCDRCGKLWPSAPVGVVHKCECSGGMCKPVHATSTPNSAGMSFPIHTSGYAETIEESPEDLAKGIEHMARHWAAEAGGVFVPNAEPVGEWRNVREANAVLKGYRRSEKYYPAIGEKVLFSGPNGDDENGFTWIEVVVVWADDIFIVTKGDGCWPTVTKHELALCKPIPPTPLDRAKAAHPDISPEIVESIFKMGEGAK